MGWFSDPAKQLFLNQADWKAEYNGQRSVAGVEKLLTRLLDKGVIPDTSCDTMTAVVQVAANDRSTVSIHDLVDTASKLTDPAAGVMANLMGKGHLVEAGKDLAKDALVVAQLLIDFANKDFADTHPGAKQELKRLVE